MFRLNVFFWVLKWAWRGWYQEVDIEETEGSDDLKGLRIIIGTWTPPEVEDRVAGILSDTVDIYAALPHHLSGIAKDAIAEIHKIREESK